MTQKETGAADVTLDLLAIQSSALEAIRDYSRYLRNAENAGLPEVAYFVHLLMEEDSARATHCQGLLRKLGSTVPCGPDTGQYIKAVREYVQAGFTHVALVQVGAERQHDFIDWSARELLPALREL